MPRYLVTGGCGFVGRHLCRSLLAQGDEVVVLDNLSNSERDKLVPGCRFLEGDVRNPEDVASAVRGADGVFHLAAVASVELCNRHWRESHLTNQTGSVTVFETAAKLGISRVVYASSAAVYGDTAEIPTKERTIAAPLTAYGVDKLGTELHAAVAARVHGLSTVGVRPFNIYGPGQDPRSPYSGVISIFASRIRAGDPVTVFGDGMQSRDFIHVSDIVELFKAAMIRPIHSGAVINGASGHSTTINELLRLISTLLSREPHVVYAPSRTGEIRHSLGSVALMETLLGVKPKIALMDGLRTMLSEAQD